MPNYQLHHVQLAIPKGGEPDARAFFGEILGLVEIDKPPALAARGGCWFRSPAAGPNDGARGTATRARGMATDTRGAAAGGLELHLGVEEPFRPARKAHPGILVEDLDDLVRRLTEAGYQAEPDELFPGYRRVYSFDPFGNRLEFLEPISTG